MIFENFGLSFTFFGIKLAKNLVLEDRVRIVTKFSDVFKTSLPLVNIVGAHDRTAIIFLG